MSRQPSATDRTSTSRFECKYLVSEEQLPALRRAIRPFVELDAHAAVAPDRRYAVSSLYLDSADCLLYRQSRMGLDTRFKLRVRTYGDGPDDPAYCEIKRRTNGLISKRRIMLPRADVLEALGCITRHPAASPPATHPQLAEFLRLTHGVQAVPTARVRYMREAYESQGSDPVRVTFDTEVDHVTTSDGNILHSDHPWRLTPVGGVIFEIKFAQAFPAWLRELVQGFELEQRTVSKYVEAIGEVRSRRAQTPWTKVS